MYVHVIMHIMHDHPIVSACTGCTKMDGDELQAFFELAKSTVTFVKQCYEDYDQDIKEDAVDLVEEVLQ